jgi:hypothetical protein
VLVAVGDAVRLVFLDQPVGSLHGDPFATMPVVRIVDLGGNTVTTDTTGVLLTATGGAGVLTCAANPQTASFGVATFANCQLSAAGTYTLTASDPAEPGLTNIASNLVSIS